MTRGILVTIVDRRFANQMVGSRMVNHRLCLISVIALVSGGILLAQKPADTHYHEAKVPAYTLPSLLPKGTATTTDTERAKLWKTTRRAKVQALFEKHVNGRTTHAPVTFLAKLVESSEEALGCIDTR